MKIIDFGCSYCLTDRDILVDDGTTKAIVSTHEDMVYIVIGTPEGKASYLLTKRAAKEIAQALLEKAQ